MWESECLWLSSTVWCPRCALRNPEQWTTVTVSFSFSWRLFLQWNSQPRYFPRVLHFTEVQHQDRFGSFWSWSYSAASYNATWLIGTFTAQLTTSVNKTFGSIISTIDIIIIWSKILACSYDGSHWNRQVIKVGREGNRCCISSHSHRVRMMETGGGLWVWDQSGTCFSLKEPLRRYGCSSTSFGSWYGASIRVSCLQFVWGACF